MKKTADMPVITLFQSQGTWKPSTLKGKKFHELPPRHGKIILKSQDHQLISSFSTLFILWKYTTSEVEINLSSSQQHGLP